MKRFLILALLVCAISGADAQNKRAQLAGVWILSGSATIEMTPTPAGEAARARYDYLRDDPAMPCIPASFTRVMHTPSPPIEVRQHKLGGPGLVQSDQMRTEERFIPDGDRMRVVVTHHDPVYYQKLVVTYPYQRLPGGEILPWDCTPEEANYKRFREKEKEQ
jgi:hypothetical protein